MRVSHYFEWEDSVTGGQSQSVNNQRKILDSRGIDYTTEPDLSADILHLNNMGPRSLYYARRSAKRDTKVVIHSHQTAEDFRNSFAFSNLLSKPMRPYLSYAYSLADRIVCPSEHNRDVMEMYTEAPKTVISNGYDPAKLEGHDDPLREEYLERYDLNPPVVFMVGHVLERKGIDAFIGAAEENPGIDFAWFGFINPTGDRLGKLLQKRSVRKKIESSPENCRFTGYVDDIGGAFAAGDIFFFPTKNENEGMALLESMHCGKPCVLRNIETFDWLEDGRDCLKAGPEEFSGAIEKLAGDENLRDKLGKQAKSRSEEFTLEKVGDDLIELYRELV
ncbi:MAG: glycosyltransferase family 4 protein [Candidatus Nanohaloarchaea archaeon]